MCCSIMTGCKEHAQHVYIRQFQLDKLAMAEHSITSGHHINFDDAAVLTRTTGQVDHLVKEAIEIPSCQYTSESTEQRANTY